jgi:hypothetical protein
MLEIFLEPSPTEPDRDETIRLAAYHLWQQRGGPMGEPEIDWFQAQEQLHASEQDVPKTSPIVAAAGVVGSVLGSVAALAASVSNLLQPDEPSQSE